MNNDPDSKAVAEIAAAAQMAWFSLLGFLAFYFLVILTTTDADFLAGTKQTQLPVVNISIASDVFYFAAPLVATFLYLYLHFLCLILWRRAQDAKPAALEAALSASLIGTIVLALKKGTRPRGIAESQKLIGPLGAVGAGLLIWLAQPVILLLSFVASDAAAPVATVRTMHVTVAHLTIACFLVSTGFGAVSLAHALAIRQPRAPNSGEMQTLRDWARDVRQRSGAERLIAATLALFVASVVLATAWMGLRSPDIRVERALLASTPANWASAEARREVYRREWCEANGLPLAVCATRPVGLTAWQPVAEARSGSCREAPPPDGCGKYFQALDARFAADLKRVRDAELETVPELDLSGRALDRMHAPFVRLVHARLENATLQGADLTDANAEGAILIGADLTDASGQSAVFDHADLTGATLSRAMLPSASFEGAILRGAKLDGASLRNAGLEHADLSPANDADGRPLTTTLAFADLTDTRLQGVDLRGVDLRGAILDGANLTGATVTPEQLATAIGNKATILPVAANEKDRLGIQRCLAYPLEIPPAVVEARAKLKNQPRSLACDAADPARGKPVAQSATERPSASPDLAKARLQPDVTAQVATLRRRVDANAVATFHLAADVDELRDPPLVTELRDKPGFADPEPLRETAELGAVASPAEPVLRVHFAAGDTLADGADIAPSGLAAIVAAPARPVLVIGYADRVGDASTNYRLALERAEALAEVLVDRGVAPSRIERRASDERDGPVSTADGVAEPANRSAAAFLLDAPPEQAGTAGNLVRVTSR